MLFSLFPWLLFCFLRQQGDNLNQSYDMHAKGDSPLSDCYQRWWWLPRRCDATTATELFANGTVRPSWASEHINAVMASRTINTIVISKRRATPIWETIPHRDVLQAVQSQGTSFTSRHSVKSITSWCLYNVVSDNGKSARDGINL